MNGWETIQKIVEDVEQQQAKGSFRVRVRKITLVEATLQVAVGLHAVADAIRETKK